MTDPIAASTTSLNEAAGAGGAGSTSLQWPVAKTSYTMGKCIGQGATSTVYDALCNSLNRKCAMKIINLEKCSNSASLEEINREIKSMKNLKHDNIVAYHASFVNGTELCIVMDLCQRGSLLDLIKFTQSKRDITYGVFDENTIATIMRDVLRGLAYIHENGLVHRDLKCGNLLVKDDGFIQIADFGVAGFLAAQPLAATGGASVDLRRYTFVGTPCWMAPEVMQQQRGYNQKADIWSIGITTLELATGQAPYAKYAPMKVLMLTLQNDAPDIDTSATIANQFAGYGQKFRKFTKACLTKDPSQRPPAKDLLNMSYIKSKAKDRDLLLRVLLSGEIPQVTRVTRHDDRAEKREQMLQKGYSGEWNFDTLVRRPQSDSSSEDEEGTANATLAAGSQALADLQAVQPQPSGPMYRITLRKRNPKQNNELQDISFNFMPGRDSTDVLARELVEADLLDGCDLLLVAHNMSELVSNPAAKERVFPLNSPPIAGQISAEAELHGYAKVLIRLMTPAPGAQDSTPRPAPAGK